MATYYEALSVQPDATEQEIRAAFKALARETHPDTHPGDAVAHARYRAASEAVAVLGDAAKRAEYDAELRASAAKPPIDPETAEVLEFLADQAKTVIETARNLAASGVPYKEQAARVGASAFDSLKTPEGKAAAKNFVGGALRALASAAR
jgi:curved DNA-binding protein CbpA